jgi:prophage regulatory protein
VANQIQQALRILRIRQVVEKTGISRASIYNKLNPRSPQYDPSWPALVRLGERTVGLVESEVDRWLESRIQSRPTEVRQ